MNTLALPRLTARGVELDTDDEHFGFLRSSIDIKDDAEELRRRMAEDGYVFLPGLLGRAEVHEARQHLVKRLSDERLLDETCPIDDAVLRPGVSSTFRPDLAMNNPPLDRLLYTGAIMEFYETFFGEPVLHYDFTWLRATSPGGNASPHCDIVYMGRGTFDVLTAWTPLGDIPIDHGALTILEGSHKKGAVIADYLRSDVDAYCVNSSDAERIKEGTMKWWDGALDHDAVALRNRLGGRWLSSSFRMGDLLTFSMGTVHASLDNLSPNKIRLSSDSRYQRASEPADERWIGRDPVGHSAAGKRGRIC